ncbi:MAG: c-type cytochrome [Candidatus Omnitrophica bacterium]|nr:c-type cytochrome [Candidatus Omnitrophota bacterium]
MHVFPHDSQQRCAVLLTVLLVSVAGSRQARAEQPAADPSAGKAAYDQFCARCHGPSGRGDGLDAKRFYPRPRDFSLGEFKFRTTVIGTPPSDDDLFRSITKGLPGSNMPDWPLLDERTRWQIVYYLKTLSPIFQQSQPQAISVARDPGPKRANRAKGKALYAKLGCGACHGTAGRANGTAAAGLTDDWGMKIRPANLTHGWAYRGGSEPESIMWRFMAGIEGSGMPSYAEAGLTPEDAWHLAYYVQSLQEPPRWNMVARATRLGGALPIAVDDPAWAAAEHTDVQTRNVVAPSGEWTDPPTILKVGIDMLANDHDIAFRLTWDDPTEDRQPPQDAIAIVFKPEGLEGDIVTLQAWPYDGAPTLDMCSWSADTGAPAEELAADFETIRSPRSPLRALAGGAATYTDGRWRMVMQRPLAPAAPEGAAQFTAEHYTSLAVAVFDGGNPDARAVSYWIDLALQSTQQQHHEP